MNKNIFERIWRFSQIKIPGFRKLKNAKAKIYLRYHSEIYYGCSTH